MLGTHLGYRHRLAALIGLCLILALVGVPAAGAIPALLEGDESLPAFATSSGDSPPALVVQTSTTGVDWTSLVLVAVVALAAAIAATALTVTALRRRPMPAPHS